MYQMYSYKGICDDVIHKDIKEIAFIDESGHYWTMTLQVGDDLKHIYYGVRWKSLRNARWLQEGMVITLGTHDLVYKRCLYVKFGQ